MEEKINAIWFAMNMKQITNEEARQQVLDLFVVMQRSEQVCSKCGCKKVCEWCEPFNQPIPPEGIVL